MYGHIEKVNLQEFVTSIHGSVPGIISEIYNPKGAGKVEQKLTEAQEKLRLKAIAFGTADGRDSLRDVNQFYVWA